MNAKTPVKVAIVKQTGGVMIKVSPIMRNIASDPDPTQKCKTHCVACATNFIGISRFPMIFRDILGLGLSGKGLDPQQFKIAMSQYETQLRESDRRKLGRRYIEQDPFQGEASAAAETPGAGAAAAAEPPGAAAATDPHTWTYILPGGDGGRWIREDVDRLFQHLPRTYATIVGGIRRTGLMGHMFIIAKGINYSYHIIDTQYASVERTGCVMWTSDNSVQRESESDDDFNLRETGVENYLNSSKLAQLMIEKDGMQLYPLTDEHVVSQSGEIVGSFADKRSDRFPLTDEEAYGFGENTQPTPDGDDIVSMFKGMSTGGYQHKYEKYKTKYTQLLSIRH